MSKINVCHFVHASASITNNLYIYSPATKPLKIGSRRWEREPLMEGMPTLSTGGVIAVTTVINMGARGGG